MNAMSKNLSEPSSGSEDEFLPSNLNDYEGYSSSSISSITSESENTAEDHGHGSTVFTRHSSTRVYDDVRFGDVPGKVLLRGISPRQPIQGITSWEHRHEIADLLKLLGIKQLNSIQKTVIPNFEAGHNCFIIAQPKNGKSLSYLLPMAESLMNSWSEILKNGRGKGPVALVLCPSYKAASMIEDKILKQIFSRHTEHPILTATICDELPRTRDLLKKNVDVMISTLEFATKKLRRGHSNWAFNLDSLRYLAFDGIYLGHEDEEEDDGSYALIQSMLRLLHNPVDKTESKKIKQAQIIYCHSKWTSKVEELYNMFNVPPVLMIVSPAQAVKYGKVRPIIYHMTDDFDQKMKTLQGILDGPYCSNRIFVACSDLDVSAKIRFALLQKGIKCCLVESHLGDKEAVRLGEIRQIWSTASSTRQIVVAADSVLASVKIHNAYTLIHFDFSMDMETPKKKAFTICTKRFVTMWDNFRNISAPITEETRIAGRGLFSHFLVTGQEPIIEGIVEFCRELGGRIPEDLSAIALEAAIANEATKPLCTDFLAFGDCGNLAVRNCLKRHKFTQADVDSNIIKSPGTVTVRLTYTTTVNIYEGQLLHFTPQNSSEGSVSFAKEYDKRSQIMEQYYSLECNRCQPEKLKTDELYGLKVRISDIDDDEQVWIYTRVKIVKIRTTNWLGQPKDVRVFEVDKGDYRNLRETQLMGLYVLPKKFCEWPNLSVDVILADLKPTGDEIAFRSEQNARARSFAICKTYIGKLRLCIGNIIWVSPLIEHLKDEETGAYTRGTSLRKELMRLKIAVENPDHLDSLHASCQKIGFDKFIVDDEEANENLLSTMQQETDEVRWAFATLVDEWQGLTETLKITQIESPNVYYGVLTKFTEQQKALQKELKVFIDGILKKITPRLRAMFETLYVCCNIVAAKLPSGEWARAIVKEEIFQSNNKSYDVFFVDSGLSTIVTESEICPIPKKLVSRLPCQIMKFQLLHIRPMNADWSTEALVVTEDLINLEKDRKLELAALKRLTTNELGYKTYEALLFSGVKEIGENLVGLNLAQYVREKGDRMLMLKKALSERYCASIKADFLDLDEDDSESSSDLDRYKEKRQISSTATASAPHVDDDSDSSEFDCVGFDTAYLNSQFKAFLGINENSVVRSEPNMRRQPLKSIAGTSSTSSVNSRTDISPPIAESSGKIANTNSSSTSRPSPVAALTKCKISPEDCSDLLRTTTNGTNLCAKENLSESKRPELTKSNQKCEKSSKQILHPKVTWFQTTSEIIFCVCVPDMINPVVEFYKRNVQFRCDGGYEFKIVLFGIVDEFKGQLTGQYYRIKFTKLIKRKWPRLLFEEGLKYPWLKADMDHVDVSDPEDEFEDRLNLQKVNYRREYDESSDSDSEYGDDNYDMANEVVDVEDMLAMDEKELESTLQL